MRPQPACRGMSSKPWTRQVPVPPSPHVSRSRQCGLGQRRHARRGGPVARADDGNSRAASCMVKTRAAGRRQWVASKRCGSGLMSFGRFAAPARLLPAFPDRPGQCASRRSSRSLTSSGRGWNNSSVMRASAWCRWEAAAAPPCRAGLPGCVDVGPDASHASSAVEHPLRTTSRACRDRCVSCPRHRVPSVPP